MKELQRVYANIKFSFDSVLFYKQLFSINAVMASNFTTKLAECLFCCDMTSLIQILFNAPFRRSSRSSDITPPRDAQSPRKAASLHGLHALRTRYEREQHKMKHLVLQGAPHLTLQLWDLRDIQLSPELPLTQRMRDRRLDLSNPDKVLAARLPSTPGSTSRTSSNATSARSGVGRQLTVPFLSNKKSKSPRQ